ncbi:Glutamyl-tRNA(Gln) amidotransferase subunit A [Achromobacter denitrificans]|jgi:Asp-tRNA(Asn)/Glu-tRNA(Gln) amidotransferase A subunit family amidase|uniref:Amidase n=1 Tax=Achromobacter denitrificans TaxID=32002 RepID=A0A6J5CNY3_ACHDE|nr:MULTISPECIES: amidase [Achromobacter]ASC68221.1 amidase [Achromobacter denitrificans]OLU01696.1 amidase [Achromobacter denitrificans]QKH40709.1 amidase [Achromobacter denitrificans]QKH52145.1 amidase [Achromobacter denitrificans]QKQ48048.1 amidase [Achromobacter denitrificans]
MSHAFLPSAVAIARRVRRGEAGPLAAARQSLAAIERGEADLRAWSHVMPAEALDALDPAAIAGGVLAGVPVGIKDVIDVAGMPTGHGAPALAAGTQAFDACAVGMLRAAGAIPIGKTVTAEFAFRTPGPTRNPHAPSHTPGGSSSGSAAAVAAGMVPVALGTQTGGSMIRPAAFCGVVGFKPSFGRVFRDGMKLTCESLDTIGWYANGVEDAQAVAQALLDEPDADDRADRTPTIAVQLGNPRAELSAEGRAEIARIQAVLGAHGVRCVSVEAERETARLLRAHDVIMHYEFARSLAPVVERRADAVSAALRQAVVEGLAIGAGQYREMRALQAELRHGWRRLYDGADAVLTPSTPGPAPRGLAHTGDASFNKIWSVLGWPCLHLPTAFNPAGLPLGMQLVGDWESDRALLALGRKLHHLLIQQGE